MINKSKNLYAEYGITLIALIITVIILLILAGTAITISINGGDIFRKTSETREKWNSSVDNEQRSTQDVLEILDMATNPDLAKYRLTVKVNEEDNTVESPYYVNYPSAKGTIKCRVLYNDNTYGLQLLAVDQVEEVILGKNDPNPNVEGEMGSVTRGDNSYNRAVITLNEKAEEYMATTSGDVLAIDARSVGSDPLNKNYPNNLTGSARQEKMFTADSSYEYMHEYNGKFFGETQDQYLIDYTRMYYIGAKKTNGTTRYWLAGYNIGFREEYGYYYRVPEAGQDGIYLNGLLVVKPTGEHVASTFTNTGIRPVFILSPKVKIIGGEGTEEVPFEIGL